MILLDTNVVSAIMHRLPETLGGSSAGVQIS